jgi:hypothetical protein
MESPAVNSFSINHLASSRSTSRHDVDVGATESGALTDRVLNQEVLASAGAVRVQSD